MNKEARLLCLLLGAAAIAGLAGCAHKPAYSEMDANKSSRNQNQNADGQAAASPPAAVEPLPAQPAPAPPPAFKTPSFMDQSKGEAKDLPSYPGSLRTTVQLGPVQGMNTLTLGFITGDPMDKIAAFFERAIKLNLWTVSDKVIDPELSEWNLKKGEDNRAKVLVKKDQATGGMNIVMVRAEKLEASGK